MCQSLGDLLFKMPLGPVLLTALFLPSGASGASLARHFPYFFIQAGLKFSVPILYINLYCFKNPFVLFGHIPRHRSSVENRY